jgi:hypothetical protein
LGTYQKDNYNIHSFSLKNVVTAPVVGLSVIQKWPYAPYHQMVASLPYAARASIFFLTMAVLTLVIYSIRINVSQIALLGALFLLPFLILMSGDFPYPKNLSPGDLAPYLVKMIPVVSLLPLGVAYYILRKKVSKEPLWLVLSLMALFMGGYVFLGFLGDEQKRNSTEALIQASLIGYVFLLTLFTRLRAIGTSDNKSLSKVREWFARRRKKEKQ